MNGKKSFLTSKTILGGLLALGGGGFGIAGYTMSAEDVRSTVELTQSIVVAGGGLLAIFGRVVASKQIG